jgi:methyltransferase (TIGR00027 family)
MSGERLSDVSRTAIWVAGMRAYEGERADRWFDDQLAGAFVSAAGSSVLPELAALPPGTKEIVAIRTRFFDDQVRAACAAGGRQVVLLAAGLDCRAFRLDWPDNVQLFELDLPDLFAFKEPLLASVGAVARCRRVVVAVDLRGQWAAALTAAGFDPGAPTMWVAEGLLPYLGQSQKLLLDTATALSASGSYLAFDYLEPAELNRMATHTVSESIKRVAPLLTPVEDSPANWLTTLGWRQHSFFSTPGLGERYGRPLPPDADMTVANVAVLMTTSR